MKRRATSQHTVGARRTEDGEDAEQQQVELVDGLAAPAVAELALARRADEHAEHGRAADPGRPRGRLQTWSASMSGISDPSTIRSITSKKYPAAISAMTLICSGEIFASSNAVPTKPSMV